MEIITTSQLIQIVALIVIILIYFANKQLSKRNIDRHESEERVQQVVKSYVQNATSHPPISSGYPGLLKAGVCTLMNDKEVRQACNQITLIIGKSPLGKYGNELKDIDLLQLFSIANSRGYDFMREGNPKQIAEEMRNSSESGAHPNL